MLPKNTSLGTLDYLEVYDYYDFPQFFSCKNELGEIFLGLAIEDNPLTFLFALVHPRVIKVKKFETVLPVIVLQRYGKQFYKVQLLHDRINLMTKEETNKLFEELKDNGNTT